MISTSTAQLALIVTAWLGTLLIVCVTLMYVLVTRLIDKTDGTDIPRVLPELRPLLITLAHGLLQPIDTIATLLGGRIGTRVEPPDGPDGPVQADNGIGRTRGEEA
ncbi:hypothetical protein [Actinoallomurus acaciae]|uniref:Uncharacterized protein n=1 Tax=Actinoallomurus acaciae TaxID=502577 RepID=A0ABV5Y957_9ACTN